MTWLFFNQSSVQLLLSRTRENTRDKGVVSEFEIKTVIIISLVAEERTWAKNNKTMNLQ